VIDTISGEVMMIRIDESEGTFDHASSDELSEDAFKQFRSGLNAEIEHHEVEVNFKDGRLSVRKLRK